MACESVKLKDGSTILVNVKRGQTLTDKDREMLEEFYDILRMKEPPVTEGYPIGGRHHENKR